MMSSKWGLLHSNGDREVTLLLTDNPTKLNRDDASKLAFHLNSFVVDMDKLGEPKKSAEGAEAHGEMLMAQYDDDPNPYHGDYSEDWWDVGEQSPFPFYINMLSSYTYSMYAQQKNS